MVLQPFHTDELQPKSRLPSDFVKQQFNWKHEVFREISEMWPTKVKSKGEQLTKRKGT